VFELSSAFDGGRRAKWKPAPLSAPYFSIQSSFCV
jgi:hypothetical protein